MQEKALTRQDVDFDWVLEGRVTTLSLSPSIRNGKEHNAVILGGGDPGCIEFDNGHQSRRGRCLRRSSPLSAMPNSSAATLKSCDSGTPVPNTSFVLTAVRDLDE